MALWVYGEGPFLEKRQGVPHFIQYADGFGLICLLCYYFFRLISGLVEVNFLWFYFLLRRFSFLVLFYAVLSLCFYWSR